MTQTPAGWFPDPDDPQQFRYWNGSEWTEHRSPRAAQPTFPESAPPHAPASPPMSPPLRGDAQARTRSTNKTILLVIGGVVGALFLLTIVGSIIGAVVGTDSDDTTARDKEPSTNAASQSGGSSSDAPADDTDAQAALVSEAEKIAKDELPSIPLWKGVKVQGHYVSDEEVCVDRTFKNGKNAGFVVVAFPDGTAGEPQNGTCDEPAPEPIDWQSKIEDAIKEKLGESNRDGVDRVTSVTYVDGVNVPVIEWAIDDNLTENMIKQSAQIDLTDMLQVLQDLNDEGMPLKGASFSGTFSMVDKLGNASEDRVVLVRFKASTIKAINFDNFIFSDVYDIADEVWLHPAFEQ